MIVESILKINTNAKFNIIGDNIDTCEIQWLDGTTPISKSDIEAQFPAVELDIAMADLRSKRNQLLTETDWMANSDVTMADNWKTYRQALRDLPTHSNWPNLEDSDWPTKPEA